MSGLRFVRVRLTAAWLSLHVLAMTGPVILACTSASEADIVCTCAHGDDHGLCPMHRTPQDRSRCRMQGTQDDLATALVTTLGPLTMPESLAVTFLDAASPDGIGYSSPLPSTWIVPPEPPPPRS